jgi:hypothetical protein
MTEAGVYIDDCAGIHPDIIARYYGVHGRQQYRRTGQSGAGHPRDEDDSESDNDEGNENINLDDLGEQIANDQEPNTRHEPVLVPDHNNPFPTPELEEIFFQALAVVREQGDLPRGFLVYPDEWEDGEYPAYEFIKSGRRGLKELRISLADEVWRGRSELWAQALDILNRMEIIMGL